MLTTQEELQEVDELHALNRKMREDRDAIFGSGQSWEDVKKEIETLRLSKTVLCHQRGEIAAKLEAVRAILGDPMRDAAFQRKG